MQCGIDRDRDIKILILRAKVNGREGKGMLGNVRDIDGWDRFGLTSVVVVKPSLVLEDVCVYVHDNFIVK